MAETLIQIDSNKEHSKYKVGRKGIFLYREQLEKPDEYLAYEIRNRIFKYYVYSHNSSTLAFRKHAYVVKGTYLFQPITKHHWYFGEITKN